MDGRDHLARGQTDVLVLTEAMPLAAQIEWNDTAGQMAQPLPGWRWQANPETRVYLYETWHSLASAPGTMIEGDPARACPGANGWMQILLSGKGWPMPLRSGCPPGRLVCGSFRPGRRWGWRQMRPPQADVPGVAVDPQSLFSDDIHPNGKGLYFVAMVHLAAITGETPEGLPARADPSLAKPGCGDHRGSGRAPCSESPGARCRRNTCVKPPKAEAPAQPRPGDAAKTPWPAPPPAAPNPVAPAAAAAGRADTSANAPAGFAPVTNPKPGAWSVGVNDWAVQQPFLDVMKTARPWMGHLPGQWGGWDHADLAGAGCLDDDGWPRRMPPNLPASVNPDPDRSARRCGRRGRALCAGLSGAGRAAR